MHNWLSPATALVAAHIVANLVWIGSILSITVLLGRAPFMADPSDAGSLARRVYFGLAVPAFLLSFVAGAGRIALFPTAYAHLPWLHLKLGLAFVVIVLHHAIGGRAKRVRAGYAHAARGVGWLGFGFFVCAAAAALLGVAKSLPTSFP